jgi:hypothetical protein
MQLLGSRNIDTGLHGPLGRRNRERRRIKSQVPGLAMMILFCPSADELQEVLMHALR